MGKQEKYKKKEDNRDIFDKIADNLMPLAPVAGGFAGMAIGRRLGGYRTSKVRSAVRAEDDAIRAYDKSPTKANRDKMNRSFDSADDELNRGLGVPGFAGSAVGIGGGVAGKEYYNSKKKARK